MWLLALGLSLSPGQMRLARTLAGEAGGCSHDVQLAVARVCAEKNGVCFGRAPATLETAITAATYRDEPDPLPEAFFAFNDSDMEQVEVQRLVQDERLVWLADCGNGFRIWFWTGGDDE
jgi:hypothetical protein